MEWPLTTVAIRYEHDVVLARQRARQIAAHLGFDTHDQVRIATAVSEIARNAFRYASRGSVQFAVAATPSPALKICVTDQGSGIKNLQEILDGRYVSETGMGMGIIGARRLMDDFLIESLPGKGTAVCLTKSLPKRSLTVSEKLIQEVAAQLSTLAPQDPFEEIQRQNQELLATLAEVQRQKAELSQLNKELEDTNRGVVALYAELDERADYLRRASELKTEFLSNMSHEFRTPLNSILSLARILLDRVDGHLTEEQERQVRFIQRAAEDLSQLVNDLLDLAKVEAGKVTLRAAPFTVNDLFGALRGMLRPLLAHNSSVALVFEESSQIPPLNTDESKVSQVLRNLISNAIKFTEHGEVRISAALGTDGFITFHVSDTGVGIAVDDHDRIFEEFTQVEGAHQVGKTGTGLGLPLSRKLAHLLGGTLDVRSELGKGSTFALRLPVTYGGSIEVPFIPELAAEVDPCRLPLLVIEDNTETLLAYEKLLKDTPFQVLPASSLQTARAELQRYRPFAIILDILLGRDHAWSFLSELKQEAATKDIPLLVVTQVENEKKAVSLGADAFHAKPIHRNWLLDILGKFVTQRERPRILIIDDDPASRYILSGFLSGMRFELLEAASGTEGLALAKLHQPSLIFLDLLMPGVTGFQVIETLKKDPATADIPFVVHTSKSLTEADSKRLRDAIAIIPKDHQDRVRSAKVIHDTLAGFFQAGGYPAGEGGVKP